MNRTATIKPLELSKRIGDDLSLILINRAKELLILNYYTKLEEALFITYQSYKLRGRI